MKEREPYALSSIELKYDAMEMPAVVKHAQKGGMVMESAVGVPQE
jgi:hypothetical protein